MFSLIYEIILRFFSLTAGCFYPAFVSFKLLNAHRQQRLDGNENRDNLSIWLTYWIVYGVWSMFDFLTLGLETCFPLLSEMKLIFIFWLLPSLGAGSGFLYDEFLYSFFSNNEGAIEHALIDAALGVAHFLDRLLRICLSHIMGVVDDYLLTRGLRQGPAANPIRGPISIDEYFAKLELEKKRKQEKTEDLENTIEKALGEDMGRDDDNLSLINFRVLNDTETDELVFTEREFEEVMDKSECDELAFIECNKPKMSANNLEEEKCASEEEECASEEIVFSECKLKPLPLILPKHIKFQPSAPVQVTMELKMVLNPNQYAAVADETEKTQ